MKLITKIKGIYAWGEFCNVYHITSHICVSISRVRFRIIIELN